MAQDALEQLQLKEIVFIPARRSPLKDSRPQASDVDRMDMAVAATKTADAFSVSDFELAAGSTSYTIRTVERFTKECPDDSFVCLIGADQASQLADWRSIDKLATQVAFGIFDRAELSYDQQLEKLPARYAKIASRRIDISSTEIRDRLKRGLPVNNFLPAPVFEIITSRKLYQIETGANNACSSRDRSANTA